MVLEHIFPESWLERKGVYALLLGIIYSIIGIVLANIMFLADPALVSVAFISMLMLPELYDLFRIEEKKEDKEKKFSLIELWKDNRQLIKIYIFLFLGIMVVYSIASLILPSFQLNTLFREQLAMRGASGDATFTTGLFWDILKNNFKVLVLCFVMSFLVGNGAIFLIVWNASVWGTIFGITARNAAIFAGVHPLYYFAIIMLIVFPHMIIEAIAYIFASISGGVLSDDILVEKFESKKFNEVFVYNFWLLVIAILVLLLGAGIETFVLDNSTTYANIIQQSMMVAA